ncbi:FadR/GntR family transcriptional regulator [Brevundimonas subvibrioides]|uniref:Regulatory protein GntR HTH n=1 Tax=Brevundimonas subvibrioides (strain ATCC 15264 / DSM 4735 / LMG 14903 / NBRC 16000 / CB 81) TaxID=633149 RepID=D9QNM1_BRESC|nr:FadR/GntR family transcriptional regulator [Brevundimonas subvibrioides]ADL02256.1 regulatory protein GntR HTH [Brevundimonas subvibrioides ATCC 15264]
MTAASSLTSLSASGRGSGQTVSSHDQIVRSLGQDILAGRIAPGDKLPGEADLLRRFGVSRTALREALKTLSAKGFLVVKTRVGTKVTEPLRWNLFDSEVLAWQVANGMDAQFRRHLAEVRRALEPAAAALAAEHRSAEDLDGMRAAIAAMRHEQTSEYAFARADLDLHLRIAVASKNPMMRSLASVIETALLEAFTLSPPTRSEALHRETVDLHERIVDRIEASDAVGAASAMLAVIDAGYRRVEAEQDAG